MKATDPMRQYQVLWHSNDVKCVLEATCSEIFSIWNQDGFIGKAQGEINIY